MNTAVGDVAGNSLIENGALIYFAVRRLTESKNKFDWFWNWIVYDEDVSGSAMRLQQVGGAANQFDPSDMSPPPNAQFRVNLESGPYMFDDAKYPDRTRPASAGPIQLEDQLRFTLQTPSGLNVCALGDGAVGVDSRAPALIWKLNWFSTQTWLGILDFGMAFANNIGMSDYPARSAYPQSVWDAVDEDKIQLTYQTPMRFVSIADGTLRLVPATAATTQKELGTLNFRMVLKECEETGFCQIDKVSGRGRKLFPLEGSQKDPNLEKSAKACDKDQILACGKKYGAAIAACAVGSWFWRKIFGPGEFWPISKVCLYHMDDFVSPNCKPCLCQLMGCPDFYCGNKGCGGEVAAPLQCYKDSDCEYLEADGQQFCQVRDPENRNKAWETDYCTHVGDKVCACNNPDADVKELQCTRDADCASTQSLTDTHFWKSDYSDTGYAVGALKSASQCKMQRWTETGIPNSYYYGGAVCANPDMDAKYSCTMDSQCNTVQAGAGIKTPQTKIGRDCEISKLATKLGVPSVSCAAQRWSAVDAPWCVGTEHGEYASDFECTGAVMQSGQPCTVPGTISRTSPVGRVPDMIAIDPSVPCNITWTDATHTGTFGCCTLPDRFSYSKKDGACVQTRTGPYRSMAECYKHDRYTAQDRESGCVATGEAGDYADKEECTSAIKASTVNACPKGTVSMSWPPGRVPDMVAVDLEKPCNVTWATPEHKGTYACCVLPSRFSLKPSGCEQTREGPFASMNACVAATRYDVDNKQQGCFATGATTGATGAYATKAACDAAVAASDVSTCGEGGVRAFYPVGPVPATKLVDPSKPCNITWSTPAHDAAYGCCVQKQ